MSYTGETSRKVPKRIKEHKINFQSDNYCKALVIRNISKNNKFDFQRSNIIAFFHDKNKRIIIESCAILHYKTIEQRPGFYEMSPY